MVQQQISSAAPPRPAVVYTKVDLEEGSPSPRFEPLEVEEVREDARLKTADIGPPVPLDGVAHKLEKLAAWLPRASFLMSWDQSLVFFTYIILYVCLTAWVHFFQGVSYRPVMMVMSVLLCKLVLSLTLFFINDGSPVALLKIMTAEWKYLTLYVLPAFAYASTDSLTVFCLRRLDPSTFAILYNIRVAFIILLWQRFMKKRLHGVHWLAMALIVGGCIVKELPHISESREKMSEAANASLGGEAVSFWNTRLGICVIVVLMAQLAAFAAVYNEKLLKQQSNLSLNVQNIAMYLGGVIATTTFSLLLPLKEKGNLLDSLFSLEEWTAIWTFPVVVSVFLMATYGLVTSFFIKRLNNLVREIASSMQILCSIPVNVILFGYPLYGVELLAVAFVIVGVGLYNRNPL